MVIGGILAGLLAIGLGIVGIAIVYDNSEDPKRDLGGKESTGTALTKQGQGQTKQGQEPGVSGPLGSAETKEIRDGDELLALKPTGVARDGSYITLEIEVAGLGNAGYDTAGLEARGTLLGSNGQPYRVESSGAPGGCETPKVTLTNGQTLNGCLPFKVPPGVQADRFQYRPFFVGGGAAEWDLE